MKKFLCGETAAIFVRRAFYFVVCLNLRIFRKCEFTFHKQNICIFFCFKTIKLSFFEIFFFFLFFNFFPILIFSMASLPNYMPLIKSCFRQIFWFLFEENSFSIFFCLCNFNILNLNRLFL